MEEDLGSCCGCGGLEDVKTIIMLEKKGTVPGRGWGCLVCGLSRDGVVVVLCDECFENNVEIKFACVGYPKDNERIAVDLLAEAHEHDYSKHPEVAQ